MKRISITITASVDDARLPMRPSIDEDEELKKFVRWLVARRTEGPMIKIAMTEKTAASHFPEPLGKQLPILDFVARAVDDDIPDEDEAEEEELETTDA